MDCMGAPTHNPGTLTARLTASGCAVTFRFKRIPDTPSKDD
jgi:hypothetical protein